MDQALYPGHGGRQIPREDFISLLTESCPPGREEVLARFLAAIEEGRSIAVDLTTGAFWVSLDPEVAPTYTLVDLPD